MPNKEFNSKLVKALKESDEMLKNPKQYKSFDNVDDLIKDLKKDD